MAAMKQSRREAAPSRRGIIAFAGRGLCALLALGGVIAVASSGGEALPLRSAPLADPLAQAKVAFADRDYARAETLAREALRLGPESRDAQILLGRALIERGRLAEARELFTRLQKEAPEDVGVLLGLALVLRRLGLVDLALVHLQHAAKLRPEDAVLWKELGQAQREKGDSMGALASFQKSLSLYGKQEDLLSQLSELASAKQDLPGLPSASGRAPGLDPRSLAPHVPRPVVPDPNDQFPKPYWKGR